MKRTYKVLAFILAADVVVQAAAIAYALAGVGKFVDDGHGAELTKKAVEDGDLHFQGVGGFAIHGINGQMVIPLLGLVLLLVSYGTHLTGASKKAGLLFGLIVVQVILGVSLHDVVVLAPLHAINAFVIFSLAAMTGVWASKQEDQPAEVAA